MTFRALLCFQFDERIDLKKCKLNGNGWHILVYGLKYSLKENVYQVTEAQRFRIDFRYGKNADTI